MFVCIIEFCQSRSKVNIHIPLMIRGMKIFLRGFDLSSGSMKYLLVSSNGGKITAAVLICTNKSD